MLILCFKKDYLLRVLNRFFESLNNILNGVKDKIYIDRNLDSLCQEYLGENKKYILFNRAEFIIDALEIKSKGDYLGYIELASVLLLEFARNEENLSSRKEMLKKSLYFLNFLEEKTLTFSVRRQNQIKEINKMLN